MRQVQAGQTIVVQQGSNGGIQENGVQRTVQTISGTPLRTVRAPPTRPGGQPTRVLVQKTPQPAPRPNQPRRQLYPINQPSNECCTFRICSLKIEFIERCELIAWRKRHPIKSPSTPSQTVQVIRVQPAPSTQKIVQAQRISSPRPPFIRKTIAAPHSRTPTGPEQARRGRVSGMVIFTQNYGLDRKNAVSKTLFDFDENQY